MLWAPVVLILRRRAILAVFAITVTLGLLFRLAGVTHGTLWTEDFFSRVDILIIGSALALWMNSSRERRFPVYLGAIAAVALAVVFASQWPFAGREVRASVVFAAVGTPLAGLATAGLLCYLIYRSGSRAMLCRVLRFKLMVWIGRRSYMIYLSHALFYWGANRLLRPTSGWDLLVTAMAALLLTLGWSAFSWRFIEAPLLQDQTGGQTSKR